MKTWCVALVCALGLMTACGGGIDPATGETASAEQADGCGGALSLPAAPADVLNVRDLGAAGDGVSDDTSALQAALDALRPGQWLVFPPGVYRHAASLRVTQADVVIDGRGATLHAVNAEDQALLIQASGVRLQGFVMTAVTTSRLATARQSRIAVWRDEPGLAPLERIEIIDNRIVESGEAGTPLANSASSAGIFVHNAFDFLIAGNTVRRSLADGIHITGGSRRGQVVFNTIRETGDDMISVVSYMNEVDPAASPAQTAAAFSSLRDANLVQDILIAGNDVSGQYWGRGITVVGGEQISVLRNTIDATTHGAAVYLAREQGYGSFGVRNVQVEGNVITRVQTTRPAYIPAGSPTLTSGHGAIELVSHQYDDEAAQPLLQSELVVRGVRILGNRIEQSATAAARIAYGFLEADADIVEGVARPYRGAQVTDIAFEANTMAAVAENLVVLNVSDPALVLTCSGNTVDGSSYQNPACGSAVINVTGASKTSCTGVR